MLRLVPALIATCVGVTWSLFVVLRPVGVIDSTIEAPRWVENHAVLEPWVPLGPEDGPVKSSLANPRFVCRGVLRTALYDIDVRLVRETPDSESAVDLSGYKSRMRC